MTEILLAVDNDEARARAAAEHVANLDWGEEVVVTVFHAFIDNTERASVNQIGSARAAREVLEEAGLEVVLAETSGDPAERILSRAETEGADVIAIAGRSRTPAGKAVFGSVSQSVMLDSDIPVLFCPVSE
jgi:nucleotide-binding universal stress UspA family protein